MASQGGGGFTKSKRSVSKCLVFSAKQCFVACLETLSEYQITKQRFVAFALVAQKKNMPKSLLDWLRNG
jgi:hypothetical protein